MDGKAKASGFKQRSNFIGDCFSLGNSNMVPTHKYVDRKGKEGEDSNRDARQYTFSDDSQSWRQVMEKREERRL